MADAFALPGPTTGSRPTLNIPDASWTSHSDSLWGSGTMRRNYITPKTPGMGKADARTDCWAKVRDRPVRYRTESLDE